MNGNFAATQPAVSAQRDRVARRRSTAVRESEPVSVVVVEAPELVRGCLARLLAMDPGATASWLYLRGSTERFSTFADRALRHALAPMGQHVTRVTYFVGHEEAIENERFALLGVYLRTLPAHGSLTLIAPAEQQGTVLSALAMLQPDNLRSVRLDVDFVSRPAVVAARPAVDGNEWRHVSKA
jgi:hypothetical protein